MNKQQDHYQVLGVPKSATQEEIKKKYRELAHKFHPDKNSGDSSAESKFKEIASAYEILGDEDKRKDYDNPRRHFGGAGFNVNIDDIFEHFFNVRNPFHTARTNEKNHIEASIEVDIQEAFKGCLKTVCYNRKIVCTDCKGEKTVNPSSIETCKQCNGNGMRQTRHPSGIINLTIRCEVCSGTGNVIKDPCKKCGANGYSVQRMDERVEIPKGFYPGFTMKVAGYGHQSILQGNFGDLYIRLNINNHEFYMLAENGDIYVKLPVPVNVAIAGGKVEVPTLHGVRQVSIPPKSNAGSSVRIKGAGYRRKNSHSFGDLEAIIQLEMPQNPNEELIKLLQQEEQNKDNFPEYNKILEKFGNKN